MNPGSLERGRKALAGVEKKQHQLDTDRTLATKDVDGLGLCVRV